MPTKQIAHTIKVDQQIQINNLANDIDVIKNNHLVHVSQNIDDLKTHVKDSKEHFNSRMDKLDNRIWWVLGLTVTTLISIMLGSVGKLPL